MLAFRLDTGHMGELLIEGAGAFESLQWAMSRDLSGMENDQGRYTLLCNERGGVSSHLLTGAADEPTLDGEVLAFDPAEPRQGLIEEVTRHRIAVSKPTDAHLRWYLLG